MSEIVGRCRFFEKTSATDVKSFYFERISSIWEMASPIPKMRPDEK
jgi:hypothetical protein